MLALITRPQKQAEKTAQMLSKQNIDSIIEPLITIEHLDVKLPKADIVIITSSNAINSLEKLPKSTQIIAVGRNTAQQLSAVGFTDIHACDGNLESIVEHIKNNYQPRRDKIIYPCADIVYGEIEKELSEYNFKKVVVYKSLAKQRFSKSFINAMQERMPDIALFYSARTAKVLIELAKMANVETFLQKIEIFCISENVAEIFRNAKYSKIHVSKTSNSESLLELIGNFKFTDTNNSKS